MKDLVLKIVAHGGDAWDEVASLRFEVFVGEQGVPVELEMDELDAGALHLGAYFSGVLVGTLRVIRRADDVKIGRVAVKKAMRGNGIGNAMMEWAIRFGRENGKKKAVVESQLPVIPFYERLGFRAFGDVFLDAGIEHRRMDLEL